MFVTALALIVTIAVFRLPEEFVAGMRRDSPLDGAASGWLFRLLALAAATQAAYVGLSILRPEKIRQDRLQDPKLKEASGEETVRTVARGAAGMAVLTLAYGIAAFVLTGERGGFWLFLVIFAGQLAWSYRQSGLAAKLIGEDGSAAGGPPGTPAESGG